jgi:hypothetical protein
MNIFRTTTIHEIISANREKLASLSGTDGVITILGPNDCCSSVGILIGEKRFNIFIGALENCCAAPLLLCMDDYRDILLKD